MITITTRYSGATNTRGSRVIATATVDGRRVSARVPFDYEAGVYGTHVQAAEALAGELLAGYGLAQVEAADDKGLRPLRTGWRFAATVSA
jgi:hypothetical protein